MTTGRFPLQSTLCAAGLASWLVCLAAQASGTAAPVGVVADFQPVRAQYTLQRAPQGETVHVHLGTTVLPGDRLLLSKPGQSVTLQLADGRKLRFDQPGEHRVPEGRTLGRLATILGSIPDLFGDDSGLGGTAVARDIDRCGMPGFVPEPPQLPAVPDSVARLVAGPLDLRLAWQGGCAPYAVELRHDGVVIAQSADLGERAAQLQGTALMPGRYELSVSGKGGQGSTYAIDVQAAAPPLPHELRGETGNLALISSAVWLAQQDAGLWMLEAVRRLEPLARQGDPLAASLQQGWLSGMPLR
jgi:hypothetical protein